MGELQNDLAVKIGNRVGAVSEFSVDKKQVIAGAINVVQPEIHAQHIVAAVVLELGAGQPLPVKCEIEGIVHLMEIHRFQPGRFNAVN